MFTEVADLAQYCRAAKEHELVQLEWWSELAEVEDDAVFAPGARRALRPAQAVASGAELLRELIAYCNLELDTAVLDESTVDRDDWRDLLDEVVTCFKPQD